MNLARLTARVVIGGLFVGHGTQKLMGWFGGPGLEGTAGMMEALELNPPRRNALLAGATETAGGALLTAGLATPLAAAGLIGTMITAIRKVHWSSGPWATSGGYEYNLVLIAGLLSLADQKPGDLTLDSALGLRFTGTRWPLAALALGAAASSASVALGRNAPAPMEGDVATPTERADGLADGLPDGLPDGLADGLPNPGTL
ncbi:MAG: putative oxidoreductase [Nocardioidaceae bacterium]|nr:putative oxidoreductase [Nocardioidaceae bacterium]